MGERVVWIEDWRSQEFGQVLGRARDGDGAWVAASDEALRLAKGTAPVVLYYDRADYERAVRSLTPEELERAVRRRRDVFRLASSSTTRVLEGVVSAMAHAAKTGDAPAFSRLTALAVDLFDGGRFARADSMTLLEAVLDADARAFAEARDLPLEQDCDELERRYRLDGTVMADLGRAQFTRAMLHVTRARLAFVAPTDGALLHAVHEQPHVTARDWIVAPWTDHEMETLRDRGKTVEVLAFDLSPLAEWVPETAAQVERDVRQARETARDDRALKALTYGRGIRFRQHAIRRRASETLTRDGHARAADVRADVLREESALRDIFARVRERLTPSIEVAVARARADAEFLTWRPELSDAARATFLEVAQALATGPSRP
jgi:hypothetical protein